ncbi:hypothetical protein AKJ51_03925 [candidate division MSBL1 archaeon SCGC-AAA382A20]|uniref:Uncharacterized protein n=1 Tax=candidate division MSBL1 archaeon SCGC-AAA382A20 TaxID=1698280 RepID=A0A133VIP3_9EURY|nr:hypothetical protein AKJ51_03925 [candidate division MSBL1 archaeon SCGC-AAA382A20]
MVGPRGFEPLPPAWRAGVLNQLDHGRTETQKTGLKSGETPLFSEHHAGALGLVLPGLHDLVAEVLPSQNTAGQIVCSSEALQAQVLGRPGAPVAAPAVAQYLLIVRDLEERGSLQLVHGEEDCAGYMAALELVGGSDVEDDRVFRPDHFLRA